jgi:alkanesulfonate monooxygenase SsuD/methylene tetrahydromethanopterin reductase-like flavin-dependent oxidoreductase (luciferase family)
VFITPHDPGQARAIVAEVRAAEAAVERRGEPLRILADLVVFLDAQPGAAQDRKNRLDELDGAPYAPDAAVLAGTPQQAADLLLEWREAGLDGFRLRPGVLPADLASIARELVPVLRGRGAFRGAYQEPTLRERLGLPRPASRYAVPASRA